MHCQGLSFYPPHHQTTSAFPREKGQSEHGEVTDRDKGYVGQGVCWARGRMGWARVGWAVRPERNAVKRGGRSGPIADLSSLTVHNSLRRCSALDRRRPTSLASSFCALRRSPRLTPTLIVELLWRSGELRSAIERDTVLTFG